MNADKRGDVHARQRRQPQAHQQSAPLFVERRGFSGTFTAMLLAIIAGGIYGVVRGLGTGTSLGESLLIALILVVGFSGLLFLIALGPIGTERRHIRVDESGLWLGRKFLPAEEIGECAVVSEGEATLAGWLIRCRGVKIGWTQASYNTIASKGPAVLVVQERAGLRRPGWLIATKDPEGLLKALTELRRKVTGAGRDRA